MQNDYYETSDFPLAVTLALWYPLESIDKTKPHKAQFIFKREKNLDQFIESYWRGEFQVEPIAFFQQMKLIKSRLYAET